MEEPHEFAGIIPRNLITAIKERRCMLFAGSGLSAQAVTQDGVPLPTWAELLKQVIEWCRDNRVDLRVDPNELVSLIDRKRFLVIAQELQERLGDRLNACLSEVLNSGKIRPSKAHLAIPDTGWAAVLTSNYDSLLEGAYALRSEGVLPPVFTQFGITPALESLRQGRFFILKLHGDVNVPGSIILGDRDYGRLLYLAPGYRAFLETLFASYTVLFVGFGGDDPDLNAVTERLSTVYERSIGQHYLLIPRDVYSSIEIRRLLEDKRLDCIPYEKDEQHTQVLHFLKAVAFQSSPGAPRPAPFGRSKKPRVFISASYAQMDLVRQIEMIVEEGGEFEAWFAERQIKPGDSILDEISQAIADCDCVIVVLSDESSTSRWVQAETQRGFAARKTIIPIRVGDAPVPPFLTAITYLQIDEGTITPEQAARLKEGLRRAVARARES
jgi:hypothetical protein